VQFFFKYLKELIIMKPLSAINFSRNNRKKLITSIISVMAAAAFLYCMQTFVKSMYVSLYQLNVAPYKTHSRMMVTSAEHPIPDQIIASVKGNDNVEKVIPYHTNGVRYHIPGSMSDSPVLGLREEDVDYFMEKHNIKLIEGRMPKEGSPEIALDYRVAKNKGMALGDKVGNAINKFEYLSGEYTIVGILKGNELISLMPYFVRPRPVGLEEGTLLQRGMIVFPKESRENALDSLLTAFPKEDVRVRTFSIAHERFKSDMSVMQMLDLISILAVIVMVISVGSSKYVQFFNRKQEFGVLNALGYTKLQVMKKAFLEISLINFIGFFLGMFFGLIQCAVVNYLFFGRIGAVSVIFDFKAFMTALYIPMFTTLFTLVPVNRMISKLDPINMIEGVV
jgi:ABC-type lipoprotein release transport system permease subunit